MRESGSLVHLLRNTPVRALLRALERDGFILQRTTRTGGHIYRQPDGRRTVIHYHRGRDTLDRKTLASVIQSTGWDESDLHRLNLL